MRLSRPARVFAKDGSRKAAVRAINDAATGLPVPSNATRDVTSVSPVIPPRHSGSAMPHWLHSRRLTLARPSFMEDRVSGHTRSHIVQGPHVLIHAVGLIVIQTSSYREALP